MNIDKRKNKLIELAVLSILVIASFVLWDTYFIYPIKLFAVILHEISHALATLLSGGKVLSMNIGFDLSGKCETDGGNQIAIASAGYIGSLLFGILYFISPNFRKTGKWLIISLSVLILSIAITTSMNFSLSILALVIFSLLIIAALYLSIPIVSILVRALGLISSIYVLFDIKEDILTNRKVITDATILSDIIGVPQLVIGLFWLAFSLVALITAIRFSYKEKVIQEKK